MKKDQVVILEKRGVILISGNDAYDFLQNIITNDIKKVSNENSTEELIKDLSKYKLRSDIKIEDISQEFVIGVINHEKFVDLQKEIKSDLNTIFYRDTPIFSDPRDKKLGARIFSNLEKLYLTIKKLNLKIVDISEYYSLAHKLGVPEKGLINLKDQLFGLEANFELFQAIDFKKGCFVGQENTARMKLKNKLRRRLLPISSSKKLNIGDEITFNDIKIGKILIDTPYPFGLIRVLEPNLEDFKDKVLLANNKECKILEYVK